MGNSSKLPFITGSVITLFYLVLSLGVYFRHDDWLIIGNAALVLPRDWRFMWEPYLFMSPSIKEVWFFRPFFKGIVWLCYSLFKNQMIFWILIHWIFILGAAFLGEYSLQKLRRTQYQRYLFFLFFISSFSLHFANVVWVGEGMMNTPQLFFLALTVFLFFTSSKILQWLSVFPYLVALGFKESSAFLPLFLGALVWNNGELRKKKLVLGIHFGLFIGFLIFRLGFLPFNPAYRPQLTFSFLMEPLFYFFICLVLPLVFFIWKSFSIHRVPRHTKIQILSFFPFLALLVAPHLGHPFFSPGWTLLPGYFLIWILCYLVDSHGMSFKTLSRHTFVVFFLSSLIVGIQVWNLSWLSWGSPQKKMHEVVKNLDPERVSKVKIKNCLNREKPQLTFQRVIGAKENLEFMGALHHPEVISFDFIACNSRDTSGNGTLVLTWNFPELLIN